MVETNVVGVNKAISTITLNINVLNIPRNSFRVDPKHVNVVSHTI
jgi:hypothetical protein